MIRNVAHDAVVVESDSLEAINDYYYSRGWTDGATIVPPTAERVEAMLAATDLPADHEIGVMPPAQRSAAVYYAAVNAVMAGCKPEYFPLVVAALEAILDPAFNLFGTQGTTNPSGVLLLVNGPLAKKLDINSGFNVLGQGWRANMTIGRAVRLCMINIGGGYPGISDMSTHGNPVKLGICFAENEDANPWGPLHVERGFDRNDSTVTAFSCSPQNVIARDADPIAVLDQVAAGMLCSGSNIRHFDGQPRRDLRPAARGLGRGRRLRQGEESRNYLFEKAYVDTSIAGPRSTGLRSKN